MTRVAIRALDAHVLLDIPGPVGDELAAAFADIAEPPGSAFAAVPASHRIAWGETADGRWMVTSGARERLVLDVGEALSATLIDVNRLATASVAADHTVLHAGTFEAGGRAVAVVGASGAGKSTLVAAAVLAGRGYVADEVCALDPGGLLRGYHRPIGLRSAGAAAIGVRIPDHRGGLYREVFPWPVGPSGSPGRPADGVPLGLVAFVERRPGPVEIVAVRPAEALVRLTALGLDVGAVARPMFRRFDALVREVPVVSVGFDDSGAAAVALVDALP